MRRERVVQVLRPLLEAEHVFKCGVGVQGDVDLMNQFAPDIEYRCAAPHL